MNDHGVYLRRGKDDETPICASFPKAKSLLPTRGYFNKGAHGKNAIHFGRSKIKWSVFFSEEFHAYGQVRFHVPRLWVIWTAMVANSEMKRKLSWAMEPGSPIGGTEIPVWPELHGGKPIALPKDPVLWTTLIEIMFGWGGGRNSGRRHQSKIWPRLARICTRGGRQCPGYGFVFPLSASWLVTLPYAS